MILKSEKTNKVTHLHKFSYVLKETIALPKGSEIVKFAIHRHYPTVKILSIASRRGGVTPRLAHL